jgi:hypothetical protein
MVLDAGWTLFGHQYGHLRTDPLTSGGGASWGIEYQSNYPPNFRLLFGENVATGPPHHNREKQTGREKITPTTLHHKAVMLVDDYESKCALFKKDSVFSLGR